MTRRYKLAADELVFYSVAIERWDWTFDFGVSPIDKPDDPLMDHRTLRFYGRLTQPHLPKVQTVEVITMDNPYLNVEAERRKKPTEFVWLELHKEALTARAQIPADASPTLVTVADRIKVIEFVGRPLWRGKAVGNCIRFTTRAPADEEKIIL